MVQIRTSLVIQWLHWHQDLVPVTPEGVSAGILMLGLPWWLRWYANLKEAEKGIFGGGNSTCKGTAS